MKINKIPAAIALLTICTISQPNTYYVATWGNDDSAGTFEKPWATWQKAFETADAGDTVYFRGGTWIPDKFSYGNNIFFINPDGGIGHNGTYGNRICFFNYPGETPILDCSLIRSEGNFNTGINIENAHFLSFRGLTIRNIYQVTANVSVAGINLVKCSNFNFENMTVANVSGRAYALFGDDLSAETPFDTTRFINCDAIHCCDSLGESPGNMADGWKCDQEKGVYFYFEGCRALYCSDDGFDVSGQALTIFNNCWAIGSGWYETGNGNGFKIGAIRDPVNEPIRIVTNCLAAYNHNMEAVGYGFMEVDYQINDLAYYRVNARIYNCTAYRNDIGFAAMDNDTKPFRNSVYKNNIAYGSTKVQDGIPYDVYIPDYPYPESHNTWDWHNDSWPPWFVYTDTVTVTDDDFVSLDSTGISGPRKDDGSLPDINFLKLAEGSDLIDAGTDVRLPYLGDAPDLGAFERE